MPVNTSLYTVSSVLILDNEGSRLFAKYFGIQNEQQFTTQTQQLSFEKSVFSKINKVNQDILLYDNHLITYKQANDIILIIVAKINENESLIYSLVSNLFDSLSILLDNTVDKSSILEKYDSVSLAIDEAIDDGIILEIDPAIIVSRVTNDAAEANHGIDLNIDLSEKGLFNALSFASKKIGERLQQGL